MAALTAAPLLFKPKEQKLPEPKPTAKAPISQESESARSLERRKFAKRLGGKTTLFTNSNLLSTNQRKTAVGI